MDECHEMKRMLFSVTQTSVGELGHGTEIASYLISNVSRGSIWNVLVMFQHICMMKPLTRVATLQDIL